MNIIEGDARSIVEKIDFSKLANKTVLITGASGLIGVYFLACLKVISKRVQGMKAIVVFQSKPTVYLQELLSFENVEVVRGDLTDVDFIKTLSPADYIIHAAGYGQPLRFMEAPEKTLKLNTLATFFLLDKLRQGGSFLFLSSSEVYSNLQASKYTEEDIGITNTTHPRSCYIEGKRAGEAICNAYRTKGVNAYSARLGHTYGPGAKTGDKRVLLSFIEKALAGRIDMLDSGNTIRHYCYVADAVEVMWSILLAGKEPVYNVGGESKITIKKLAELIAQIMKVPVSIPDSSKNSVAGAPAEVALDTTKVQKEFNKTQYVDLQDGLSRTIAWYQNTQHSHE